MHSLTWEEYKLYVNKDKCPPGHEWISMNDSYPPLEEEIKTTYPQVSFGDSVIIEAFMDNNDISYQCIYRMILPNLDGDAVYLKCVDVDFTDIKYWRWAYPAPKDESYNVG